MSQKIAAYRNGQFSHFLKRKPAERKVFSGAWRWRDKTSIEAIEHDRVALRTCFHDGRFGTGNMVPFTRVPNPWKKPHALHYSVPACGAHTPGRACSCSECRLARAMPVPVSEVELRSA